MVWQPVQESQPQAVDMRALSHGPKGYKERNKRRYTEVEGEEDEAGPSSMHIDAEAATAADAAAGPQSGKRQKADDTTWRPVSGKVWKRPGQQASTIMKAGMRGKKTWATKMAERDVAKAQLEVKRAAAAEAKEKRKAVHDQRRAAAERKKANQLKSQIVQKVTNSATVKKLMKNKKQKKFLKTADTN